MIKLVNNVLLKIANTAQKTNVLTVKTIGSLILKDNVMINVMLDTLTT